MPRGYRYVIVAAFGWLALGAATHTDQKSKTTKRDQAAQQERKTGSTVIATVGETDKSPEKDRGCKRGQDDHSSDLCAQWKAADAAQDAADYAFWSLIGTVFGTGLLVWTLWETRSASRRELRAYVAARPETLTGFVYSDGSAQYSFTLSMHNAGNTPAYSTIHAGNLVAFSENDAVTYFSDTHKQTPHIGLPSPVTIQIGEKVLGQIEAHEGFDQTIIASLYNGSKTLFAFGFVEYRDAFGIKRFTRYCYKLPFDDFKSGDAQARKQIGTPIPVGWDCAPFHNEAT